MAGTPTVSVVITAYNQERYLGRAIESVFAQDYPTDAFEVIVVDDGSTDGTAAVAASYGDRIRYVHQPNGGHLAAYDRGIGETTGEYIALLDGDDEWLPHKVSAQVALLEARPEVGLVHGDMRLVDAAGRVLAESLFADRGMTEVEGDLLGVLMRRNMVTTTLMVRGSLRERFHPIPSWGRAQDWWIALRVAEVAEIGCLHDPVADYRQHATNMNNGRKGRDRAQLLRRELPLRRWLLTHAPEGRLGGDDLSAALATFETVVESASEQLGLSRRELVPVDRALAEERLAEGRAADAPDEAARHLVAALAHDPWNAVARRELVAAGRRGGWIAAPGAAGTTAADTVVVERPRIEGARAFVTLADAAELGERPELLAAYARVFSATDDATLVIRLGSDPEALDALEAAVAAAGLDGEDAADLLAVPADAMSLAALAPSVDAVLSTVLPEGPLAALPCAGADGVAALAALARGEGEKIGRAHV